MTVRTRKSAPERKAEIVETAIRLAADIGPDRLTTEQLATEIGISQPAIFRHFPTKDAIWENVAERICKLMGSRTSVDTGAAPDVLVRRMVAAQLDFIKTTPAVPAILFSRELHAQNDTLRQIFANLMSGRQKRMAGVFAKGVESGVFRKDLDTDAAAYLVLTLIQGLAMRWSLENRAFDLVSEGGRLLDLQMHAYLATPE